MAKSNGAVFCLIYCKTTDRFLMEYRSKDVSNPHQYGFFGGGVEDGESKIAAMTRELREETGLVARSFDYALKMSSKKPIHLFVKIMKNEFKPRLSWESESYRWVQDLADVQPLHSKILNSYGEVRRLMQATRVACAPNYVEPSTLRTTKTKG